MQCTILSPVFHPHTPLHSLTPHQLLHYLISFAKRPNCNRQQSIKLPHIALRLCCQEVRFPIEAPAAPKPLCCVCHQRGDDQHP